MNGVSASLAADADLQCRELYHANITGNPIHLVIFIDIDTLKGYVVSYLVSHFKRLSSRLTGYFPNRFGYKASPRRRRKWKVSDGPTADRLFCFLLCSTSVSARAHFRRPTDLGGAGRDRGSLLFLHCTTKFTKSSKTVAWLTPTQSRLARASFQSLLPTPPTLLCPTLFVNKGASRYDVRIGRGWGMEKQT